LLIDFAAKVLVKMQSAAFSDGVARREKTKFTKKKKYKTKTKLCTLVFCWLAIWPFGRAKIAAPLLLFGVLGAINLQTANQP